MAVHVRVGGGPRKDRRSIESRNKETTATHTNRGAPAVLWENPKYDPLYVLWCSRALPCVSLAAPLQLLWFRFPPTEFFLLHTARPVSGRCVSRAITSA